MTMFTPECLARTDFPRLVRNDPSSARQRLEALVADPEALELYGECFSSKSMAACRLIDDSGWDELRHRILREGLGQSTLDDETLGWLAQDFDALVELQFDLFSAESPQDHWQRLLAPEAAGRRCSEMHSGEQSMGHADAREFLAEPGKESSNANNARMTSEGGGGHDLTTMPEPCDLSHRMAPSAPSGIFDVALRREGFCVSSGALPNIQKRGVDRRGWTHWSNHLCDHHTSDSRVILWANCDTRTKPDLTSLVDVQEWVWPTFDTLAAMSVDLLRSTSPSEFWSHALESQRHRHECHGQKGSWLHWLQRRVSFLHTYSKPCEQLKHDVLVEHIALLSGSFSTFNWHWTREGAESIVVFVGPAIQAANANVFQRVEPHAANESGGRTEAKYGDHFRNPDGQSTRNQLPDPRPSGSRKELASTF